MLDKQILNKKKILNTKIPTELSGYNAHEVDALLDDVMKDYEFFEKKIDRLERDLDDYKKSLDEKEQEYKEIKLLNNDLKEQITTLGSAANSNIHAELFSLKKEIGKLKQTNKKDK